MTLDDLLVMVDDALTDWAVVKEDIPELPEHLIENAKWIIHYAKTKGWYVS